MQHLDDRWIVVLFCCFLLLLFASSFFIACKADWILIFCLSNKTGWWTGLRHYFQLHFTLYDVMCLQLIRIRLSCMIQSRMRLLRRSNNTFWVVLILCVISLITCLWHFTLFSNQHRLRQVMLFDLILIVTLISIVVAALCINKVHFLLWDD